MMVYTLVPWPRRQWACILESKKEGHQSHRLAAAALNAAAAAHWPIGLNMAKSIILFLSFVCLFPIHRRTLIFGSEWFDGMWVSEHLPLSQSFTTKPLAWAAAVDSPRPRHPAGHPNPKHLTGQDRKCPWRTGKKVSVVKVRSGQGTWSNQTTCNSKPWSIQLEDIWCPWPMAIERSRWQKWWYHALQLYIETETDLIWHNFRDQAILSTATCQPDMNHKDNQSLCPCQYPKYLLLIHSICPFLFAGTASKNECWRSLNLWRPQSPKRGPAVLPCLSRAFCPNGTCLWPFEKRQWIQTNFVGPQRLKHTMEMASFFASLLQSCFFSKQLRIQTGKKNRNRNWQWHDKNYPSLEAVHACQSCLGPCDKCICQQLMGFALQCWCFANEFPIGHFLDSPPHIILTSVSYVSFFLTLWHSLNLARKWDWNDQWSGNLHSGRLRIHARSFGTGPEPSISQSATWCHAWWRWGCQRCSGFWQ